MSDLTLIFSLSSGKRVFFKIPKEELLRRKKNMEIKRKERKNKKKEKLEQKIVSTKKKLEELSYIANQISIKQKFYFYFIFLLLRISSYLLKVKIKEIKKLQLLD